MTERNEKAKATKSKVKPKASVRNPKATSAEEINKYEPLIQDRIKGLTVGELSKKHGLARQNVRKILDANAERIQQERDAFLADRREKIDKALDQDVAELAELLTESTRLMRKMVDRINARLDDDLENPLKDRDLAALSDVAVKAVDRVHTVVLNQQKEAIKK